MLGPQTMLMQETVPNPAFMALDMKLDYSGEARSLPLQSGGIDPRFQHHWGSQHVTPSSKD